MDASLFSQTVEEYQAGGGDVWIKGIKDGVTRIRIVDEIPQWTRYLQHYSTVGGYVPCARLVNKAAPCVGCEDPDESDDGPRKISVQYAFNAIDENGRVGVYKLGGKAYKLVKSRYDRLGTITDRDHNIVREGKGFDTTYIPEPGEKYEVEIPEKHDVASIIAAKYKEAETLTKRAWEQEKTEAAAAEQDAAVPFAKEESVMITEDVLKNKPGYMGVVDADEAQSVAKVVTGSDLPDFDDMGNSEIKKWLESRNVEVPPRPSRSKLMELAASAPPF